MSKKWVALCSLAIGAIYVADYYVTEPQANAMGLAVPPSSITATSPQATEQPSRPPSKNVDSHEFESRSAMARPQAEADHRAEPSPSSKPAQQPQSTSAQSGQPSAVSKYKNGTYTGMGSNRRGSIEVTVTIKNNKITDVEISRFAMHYTIKDVVGLPAEVLQKQSAMVNNVSGATYSTRAFQDAVQAALTQAMNG